MKLVDPVVDDTERTDNQKGPEMTQLAKMRIECNRLKRLVATSAACKTGGDGRTQLTFPNPISSATDIRQPHGRLGRTRRTQDTRYAILVERHHPLDTLELILFQLPPRHERRL
jgi:hypothetical protein